MNDLPNRDLLYPHEDEKFKKEKRNTNKTMIDKGANTAKKIGGVWRIPRQKFLDWFEKQPSSEDLLSA